MLISLFYTYLDLNREHLHRSPQKEWRFPRGDRVFFSLEASSSKHPHTRSDNGRLAKSCRFNQKAGQRLPHFAHWQQESHLLGVYWAQCRPFERLEACWGEPGNIYLLIAQVSNALVRRRWQIAIQSCYQHSNRRWSLLGGWTKPYWDCLLVPKFDALK